MIITELPFAVFIKSNDHFQLFPVEIMMKKQMLIVLFVTLTSIMFTTALSSPVSTFAQSRGSEPDIIIDAATRLQVIEITLKQLNDNYVFPEVAKQIDIAIRERLRRKEYDQITNPATLAEVLTAQLGRLAMIST